jgi:MEMO1 family protein
MVRQPAVAGQFYPEDGKKLRMELDKYVVFADRTEKALGIIAPHAGYIYSGSVAGQVYGQVTVPSCVIILGPNHHGLGAQAALYPEGEWLTPLGTARINTPLAELVRKHASIVQEDTTAHHYEHSLEVQLPFLQYVRPDVSIVPICLGFGDYSSCVALGSGIAGAIGEYCNEVLIVASSDMTHYEPAAVARRKDNDALREILALNPEGLLKVCRDKGITMCGVIPATVMLLAALQMGASQAKLVSYATSGDVTGENQQVVAYAALTVS